MQQKNKNFMFGLFCFLFCLCFCYVLFLFLTVVTCKLEIWTFLFTCPVRSSPTLDFRGCDINWENQVWILITTKLTWTTILSKTIKCWSTSLALTSDNVFLTLALTTIFITNSWFWASGVTVTFLTNAPIEWIHWNGFQNSCALWQYRLWSFKSRDTKLERRLPKTQHAIRKLLNFENWCSSKASRQKLGIILVIKWLKNGCYQKM